MTKLDTKLKNLPISLLIWHAPALVHWRQSWFGRHIDRIDPVESPDAP